MTGGKRGERVASTRTKSVTTGRYDGIKSHTRAAPGGRAAINARLRTVQPVEAAVDDPYGPGRILVTVNRRTDILEMERSHSRISEADYRTGQIVQAMFQRMGYAGLGAANLAGGSRGDPVEAVDRKLQHLFVSAKSVRAMMDGMTRHLGMIDTRLLRRILGDRMSYAQCAEFEGKSGERGERYVAQRFRDALKELAKAWQAKARTPPPPEDKYSERAATAAK